MIQYRPFVEEGWGPYCVENTEEGLTSQRPRVVLKTDRGNASPCLRAVFREGVPLLTLPMAQGGGLA
jgi:hypothetical protein